MLEYVGNDEVSLEAACLEFRMLNEEDKEYVLCYMIGRVKGLQEALAGR